MKRVMWIGLSAAMLVVLNGCLLTSPYWNQEFSDHTKPIPLQAFTVNKAVKVKFQCAQAFHGGLYPFGGPISWVQVANVTPQSQALLDPASGTVYGAGKLTALPSSCWRLDPGNNLWYAAIRATQNETVLGSDQKYFHTFTKAGLECVGRENGKAATWFGWFNKGCQTGTYYTIFRAKT